jgi:LuxR family transcriptional regulator, maltose regulon positive regulatory protein
VEKAQVSAFRFRPPLQRVEIIRRSDLLDRLDEAASGRLILLQAPAGYGKTTLLAQWWESLNERGVRAAWLALDEDSRTPIGFVAQLVQAVASSGLDVGELSSAAQQAADAEAARRVLKALVDMLDRALGGRLVVIFDDYHLAQSPEIDDLVDLFVRRLADRANLVIATRRRPGLALAALRAQGHLRELGADQLRFSSLEVFALLGSELENERLRGLVEKSEGWPIALQLARLWVRDESAPAMAPVASFVAGGDLADYLATQVFDALPEALRIFLLEMSTFTRFNSALADVVRGATDSFGLMEQLKRRNMLMIPADPDGVWYRQHHLISDFLDVRRHELGQDRLAEIHARASAWFEQHGLQLDAVRHAAAAEDSARAVGLVEDADCIRLCLVEGAYRAQSLLAFLKPQEIESSARLRLVKAVVLFKQGKLREGGDELDAAERQAAQASFPDSPDFRKNLLIVKALKAAYRGDYLADADRQAFEALISAEPEMRVWLRGFLKNLLCLSLLRQGETARAELCAWESIRDFEDCGNMYGCAFMSFHLGTIYIIQGKLREALAVLEGAERLALERFDGNPSMLALARLIMARVAYETNDIERAADLLGSSLQTVISSEGWPEIYEIGFSLAADLAIAKGDRRAAEAILAQGCEVARARQASRAAFLFLAKGVRIMAREERGQEARAAVSELARLQADHEGLSWPELDEIALARAHAALLEDARLVDFDALSDLSTRAASQSRFRSTLRADVLRALAWFELGRLDEAVGLIGDILERAHADGYRRLFLDEGARMARLLRETLKRPHSNTIASFLPEVLASFSSSTPADQRARLQGALTPREREILRELSRGVPNKLIARALDLSENSVKFHLKNIYRKLDVVGRSMAIAVSNKLELCD